MSAVLFENQEFETRHLNLQKFGNVLIATSELSDKLMTEDCEYVSDEACYIDEKVFFFVEKSEMRLSNKKLSALIYKAIK